MLFLRPFKFLRYSTSLIRGEYDLLDTQRKIKLSFDPKYFMKNVNNKQIGSMSTKFKSATTTSSEAGAPGVK